MRQRQTRQALAVMLSAGLCLLAATGQADVPTERQQCETRNLAICEFGASGVQSTQPGPCPDGSRTIKPSGAEDCTAPTQTARRAMPPSGAPIAANTQRTDLAWVGDIERWLIPVLLYILIGVAALYAWFQIRRRTVGSPAPRGGAVAVLISGVCAAFCGWKAAAATFSAAFNSFDNHDSAAPLLLATPVWALTFGVVASLVFSILMRGCKWLRARV